MNQTVKIFFTDMDDTLLNSEKQVTKENMDAISEALAAGHKIVFNTCLLYTSPSPRDRG